MSRNSTGIPPAVITVADPPKINYLEFLQQVAENVKQQLDIICKEISSSNLPELTEVS